MTIFARFAVNRIQDIFHVSDLATSLTFVKELPNETNQNLVGFDEVKKFWEVPFLFTSSQLQCWHLNLVGIFQALKCTTSADSGVAKILF